MSADHDTTVARSRGYYLNGLKAWRIDLYKQLRQEMARIKTLYTELGRRPMKRKGKSSAKR